MNFVRTVFMISMFILLLTGCGVPLDEQLKVGFANTKEAFAEDVQKTTVELEEIMLYLPEGYDIEPSSQQGNYLLKDGKDSYILFVNTLESRRSQIYYEPLMQEKKDIVKIETFESENEFGFAAVVKREEDYELIVASGGVKITTISEDKKIDEKLVDMTNIVRSLKAFEKRSK